MVRLEQEIIDVIRRCCVTEKDKEEAKQYFKHCSVNDLIDTALEE